MSAPSLATPGGFVKAAGFEGQIATLDHPVTISRKNESATAISFGRAVARGASGGCKPPGASGDIIIGISVRDTAAVVASTDGNNTTTIAQNGMVTVLKDGHIYAVAIEAVRDGDQVLALTSGGGTLTGTQGGAASSTRLVVTGAVWQGAVGAGEIGIIRISGPSEAATTTT
jgi:hypothetical protein